MTRKVVKWLHKKKCGKHVEDIKKIEVWSERITNAAKRGTAALHDDNVLICVTE